MNIIIVGFIIGLVFFVGFAFGHRVGYMDGWNDFGVLGGKRIGKDISHINKK